MPSETPLLQTEVEKPQHFTYLKEFRTQQCPLFLQHKCTLHRPFTCFHWHFLNQRRRRPVRRRDGTFNYSPDIYCTKYDETTGICPNGNDCPYLHRTAGDTERRYHLRYYKTGTCVYETDPRGHCAKNGPHCAFAHGATDLRPPVYDIHELKTVDQIDLEKVTTLSSSPSSLEKEQILAEDPKWNDTNYVLHYYKTEPCKRPPRLCRQGYACPQYHNTRDRRRSPKNNKYRSTPCPNVKHGDEWGDPSLCENNDNCAYCHTRTEQQFHTEIYKSTKCNDMVQSGYCPRGPFCAFAHVEQEMTSERDVAPSSDNSLAAFLTNALPNSGSGSDNGESKLNAKKLYTDQNGKHVISSNVRLPDPIGKERTNSTSSSLGNGNNYIGINHSSSSPLPEPIGKGRSSSVSSSISSDVGMPWTQYLKAPGSERDDFQGLLRKQLQAIDSDLSIDANEKNKRKQNLILLHNMNVSNTVPSAFNTSSVTCSQTGTVATGSLMSALAPAFYPPGDTVESVIGKALDDISLDDFDILDKEFDNDNNSVSSSISCGLSASGCLGSSSISGPIGIPPNKVQQRGSVGSLSQSPPSPFGSFAHSMVPLHQLQKEEQLSSPFLGHPSSSKYPNSYSEMNSMSPRSTGPQSPMNYGYTNNNHGGEMLRIKDSKTKDLEGVYRTACDAWKKAAEESHAKTKQAEEDKLYAIKQRDEAVIQAQRLKQEIDRVKGGPYFRCLSKSSEIDTLSNVAQLRQIRQQLQLDLERVDKIISHHTSSKCLVCQEKNRTIAVLPCNHRVMCETCAQRTRECPFCQVKIQTASVNFNC
ncbi:hypothetical protein SNE40_019353 [Patella caerulea]|uniref:RING finger protein unkempt n=1 Tax=Patella caerulea TaxID=87958 RepID=A0AAN8JAZ7_PATCE